MKDEHLSNLEREKEFKEDFDRRPGDFDVRGILNDPNIIEVNNEDTTVEEMKSLASYWKANYLRFYDDKFWEKQRKEQEEYIKNSEAT